jgi:hypothetical protein
VKNAGRRGRKLGPYRTAPVTPVYVTRVPDDELADMARSMVPATPWEHAVTRAVLDVDIRFTPQGSEND